MLRFEYVGEGRGIEIYPMLISHQTVSIDLLFSALVLIIFAIQLSLTRMLCIKTTSVFKGDHPGRIFGNRLDVSHAKHLNSKILVLRSSLGGVSYTFPLPLT